MATIDDVARLAGVSTATVSRALRGRPEVATPTRARVLDAARVLGYVASPSASRLAGGKTWAVGVVVPRITRWFFATVVEAIEETLQRSGYDMVLYNLGGRSEARRRLLRGAALAHRVDALLLVSFPLLAEDVRAVEELRLPVAVVGEGQPRWSAVRIDDVAAARSATEHLVRLGHRRIAQISGDPADELALSTHIDRQRGYHVALSAAGIAADPLLHAHAPFTVAGGAGAMAELLRRAEPPTAVFAACDEMAIGAMATLREAGLRVPRDVSVVGIDDHDLAAAVGLSTVAQPAAELGRRATALLLEPPGEPATITLPTRLVVRDSTDRLRSPDQRDGLRAAPDQRHGLRSPDQRGCRPGPD